MHPQLIIDNDVWQPAVINIMRAITTPTLLQSIPDDMAALLTLLNAMPGTVPTLPTVPTMPPVKTAA